MVRMLKVKIFNSFTTCFSETGGLLVFPAIHDPQS